MKQKKGGAGRVVIIILAVIAALGAAGYFGLRAFIQSKMDQINSISLSTTKGQEAPDFALPLTDGSEAKLSELHGEDLSEVQGQDGDHRRYRRSG